MYSIKVELLSEAIFQSGDSLTSVSDNEITYDNYKIPYYSAKSLKGNLRDISKTLVNINPKNIEIYESLFGSEFKNGEESGKIKISNLTFSDDLTKTLKNLINENKLQKDELLNSLTDIRYQTTIDETGTTKNGSLRNLKVLNKDLIFYSKINSKLTKEEESFLCVAVSMLKHIGSLRSVGKGYVKCTLLKNNKEIDLKNSIKVVK